ncbi:DUF883 family protein [Vulcaniibacterium gelatinicum]|uniref:DUF883 family protein n=1 Tax=Vulcaniibacterium gelatinicum TaxID=2598725 RepID=UPI0015F2E068|nr:DUF883 family protein [Vulcaniibacterium gelatinicum]
MNLPPTTDGARVRQDLRSVVRDIESIVRGLGDATSDRSVELKSRALMGLADARDRLDAMEHGAAARLRIAGRHGRQYVRERPWLLVGAAAVAGLALAALLRHRR